MDAHLKSLAEAALALTAAEEAAAAGAALEAAAALDRADAALQPVRAAWPRMRPADRALIGRAAAPLRHRLDRGRARLPRRLALSRGTPERDPEEDLDPAASA